MNVAFFSGVAGAVGGAAGTVVVGGVIVSSVSIGMAKICTSWFRELEKNTSSHPIIIPLTAVAGLGACFFTAIAFVALVGSSIGFGLMAVGITTTGVVLGGNAGVICGVVSALAFSCLSLLFKKYAT